MYCIGLTDSDSVGREVADGAIVATTRRRLLNGCR